jgi:predicted dehydrogenase
MSVAYAKVLSNMNASFDVIGRGTDSAKAFFDQTGIMPFTGGIFNYLEHNTVAPGTAAIVVTGTEALLPVVLSLLRKGIADILVEKPAAISIEELLRHETVLEPFSERIFVAYNRRYYASVVEARRLIDEDGGLSSMHFEFTEWSHTIEPLKKAEGVKENWFFANSTHVIDLAFYLGGLPKEWSSYAHGSLKWHAPSSFAGAGITDRDVLFSYQANWEAPGRWAVELLTRKRRIYLKPMEKLFVQQTGSVAIEPHVFDDRQDIDFKPGLYAQTKAFIEGHDSLLSLKQHLQISKNVYARMLGKNNV